MCLGVIGAWRRLLIDGSVCVPAVPECVECVHFCEFEHRGVGVLRFLSGTSGCICRRVSRWQCQVWHCVHMAPPARPRTVTHTVAQSNTAFMRDMSGATRDACTLKGVAGRWARPALGVGLLAGVGGLLGRSDRHWRSAGRHWRAPGGGHDRGGTVLGVGRWAPRSLAGVGMSLPL